MTNFQNWLVGEIFVMTLCEKVEEFLANFFLFLSHIFKTFRSGSYKGHFAKVLETIDNSLRQNIVMKNFSKGKKNLKVNLTTKFIGWIGE